MYLSMLFKNSPNDNTYEFEFVKKNLKRILTTFTSVIIKEKRNQCKYYYFIIYYFFIITMNKWRTVRKSSVKLIFWNIYVVTSASAICPTI